LPERPSRREFHLEDKVKASLERASRRERDEFFRLLDQIREDPFEVGSLVKDEAPSVFTASMSSGVLLYLALPDHHVVWVLQVTWLGDYFRPD
jgi:hypothetical protein